MLGEKMNLSLAQIMQTKIIYISLAQIMQSKTIFISLAQIMQKKNYLYILGPDYANKNYLYILDGHVVHILLPGPSLLSCLKSPELDFFLPPLNH